MNRFFVDKSAVKESTIEINDKEDIKHISKVLRLRVGDKIEISDSNEFEYITEILSIDPSLIKVKILDKQRFAREPELKVSLFQSIPKGSRWKK
ncbi:MAG: RsmE family RNA methyltransferase [Clostridiales bacterium]|nr:RsmE family RNA methyltransferase [Clostridiales bacterium]